MLAKADGLTVTGRNLRAAEADAQHRLLALLGRATTADDEPRRGGAVALPRPSGRRALAALVTPARGETCVLTLRQPLALVSVVDPESEPAIAEDQLRDLFGFTPAEARIAAELVAGHDPKAISDRLGLSINTVRLQIARIRDKTDTGRQSEFVSLILRTLSGRTSA